MYRLGHIRFLGPYARAFKVTEFRRRPEVTKSSDREQRLLPSSLANSDSTGSAPLVFQCRSSTNERSVNQRQLFEPNENNDRLFALRAVQFTRLLAVSSTLNPTGAQWIVTIVPRTVATLSRLPVTLLLVYRIVKAS